MGDELLRMLFGNRAGLLRTLVVAAVGEVEAVVLETDGSFSVIKSEGEGRQSTSLAGLARGG